MKKIILMMMALTYALLANEAILSIDTGEHMANDAILSIDTGGHTAKIGDIIVTKSGDIISASDDKTIRVWSSRDGAEKRKILGQIGAGSEGIIYAIALSPDEQYLAVSGYFNDVDSGGGAIRLYDYQSGKLLTILKSHTNVVLDLVFSPDGKYLASSSGDTTVKLWDMSKIGTNALASAKGGTKVPLPTTITFHTKEVYGVKFTDKNTLISSGLDNRIALHSLAGKLLNSYTHNKNLNYIATNGKTIATCGNGKTILLFDTRLNLQSKIQSETVPFELFFSPDGRYLIAGAGAYPLNVNIYDSQKNYAKIATFDKHTNTTQAVAFLDNETAISSGGNNNEIYVWNFGTDASASAKGEVETPLPKTTIVGAGQKVWSVGCEGESIAWGNILTKTKGKSKFQKSFNLKTLVVGTVIANEVKQSKEGTATTSSHNDGDFKRINSDGLSRSKGGNYGFGNAVLNIESSGVSITKDATNGLKHNCYGWYKDYVISGGMHGQLKIYDTSGAEIASLVGHTGEIWSIALDGDRLVSGSDDQTIKVWDLSSLRGGTTKQSISPLLTLFVGSDNEWVMWTPEGFFNASKNGAKYIGYHINKGSKKEAEFIGVDKLYSSLYRPNIVKAKLEGKDITKLVGDMTFQKALKNPPAKIRSK